MIDYPARVALEIFFFNPYDAQAASTTEIAQCLWIDVGVGTPFRRYTCKHFFMTLIGCLRCLCLF